MDHPLTDKFTRPELRVRAGVSLIEVLVVVATLAALVALLLPAVQQARAAARRIECADNLRQITLAAFLYQDDEGRLVPPAHPVRTLVALVVPTFEPPRISEGASDLTECPADFLSGKGTGQMNYHACAGLGPGSEGILIEPASRSARPRDVSDGLSNTALFSERLAGRDLTGVFDAAGPAADSPRRGVWFPVRTPATRLAISEECFPGRVQYGDLLRSQSDRYGGQVDRYDHVLQPNRLSCKGKSFADGGLFTPNAAITASSDHVGGVNVAYGDGRVLFVSDTIDLSVWRAAGTIAGGEIDNP